MIWHIKQIFIDGFFFIYIPLKLLIFGKRRIIGVDKYFDFPVITINLREHGQVMIERLMGANESWMTWKTNGIFFHIQTCAFFIERIHISSLFYAKKCWKILKLKRTEKWFSVVIFPLRSILCTCFVYIYSFH